MGRKSVATARKTQPGEVAQDAHIGLDVIDEQLLPVSALGGRQLGEALAALPAPQARL